MVLVSLDIARRILWSGAAALGGALLFSLALIESVPAPLTAALFVLGGVAAWKPGIGLTVVAFTMPLASWTGRTWDGSIAWPEVIAVAFLLGYAIRQAFASAEDPADVLSIALHVTIVIVLTSLGVQLLVLHGTIGAGAFGSRFRELATGHYFVGYPGFESVDAGMRLIEGLLLTHAAAAIARTNPSFGPLLARTIVIAAAAASALNVWRIWLGALRLDSPITAFVRYLVTLRFNTHYSDVNAAGSYFAMMLLVALGTWRWMPFAILIALSLMLSGSRAAVVAAVAAVLIVWWATRGTGRNRPLVDSRLWKATAVLAGAACVALLYLSLARNMTPATTALRIRAEYVRTGVDMLASRPIFGIGIGQFPVRLVEFASPGLMALYPVARENAHNNFLQILAELGAAGFAAFLWVLGVAAIQMRPLWSTPSDRLQLGVCAGLLTFVLTWMAGHPLLTDAPALSFWLLLGGAAGWGRSKHADSADLAAAAGERPSAFVRSVRWRIVTAGVIIALAASVPVRARHELRVANLEHLGIGLSGWTTGSDGVEYRLAGSISTVFVPADARVIDVPLRAVTAETDRVELYLDGQFADVFTVSAESWRVLTLQIPQRDEGRRFRALELKVRKTARDSQQNMLMIGKVQPRWQ